MNDVADLTDAFNDIIDEYTGELGGVVDIDAWHTYDIERCIRILEQVLSLRADEYED